MSQIKHIRDIVQVFDSYTPYDGPDPSRDEYVDLYHFAMLVKAGFNDNAALVEAAQSVMDAVNSVVIYEAHQSAQDIWSGNFWDLDNAHGIAIYFPPFSGGGDYERYVNEVQWAFTAINQWDDFVVGYFSLTGLPPNTAWTDPGYATMQDPRPYRLYLPMIARRR